ncbi:MAG: folate-binding protein YgfZ, partial [Verrucomicrobia bacterium]|nr:folate-binding protein YgfZ [Verrucomicrobiota bacterium]
MNHVDLSARAKFWVTGSDRLRYLNGQLTNDLNALVPRRALYAFALTVKGKLAGDLYLREVNDAYLIDAPTPLRESLLGRLERYVVADDVTFEDVTDRIGLWHFPQPLPPGDGSSSGIIRSGSNRYRREGTDLFFEEKPILPAGTQPLDDAQAETLRVEAAFPCWGRELDENVLPQEVGLDALAISYTKGCYLGQEVVSRIKSIGHVNRQLVKLRLIEDSELREGMALAAPDRPGVVAGTITSVAPLPVEDQRYALGFVRRALSEAGTRLGVVGRPGSSGLIGVV